MMSRHENHDPKSSTYKSINKGKRCGKDKSFKAQSKMQMHQEDMHLR